MWRLEMNKLDMLVVLCCLLSIGHYLVIGASSTEYKYTPSVGITCNHPTYSGG